MQSFTFKPTNAAANEVGFRVRTAQFGDGYAQEAGDGINGKEESWTLTFVGIKEKVFEIRDFLDEHAGYKSFLWESPTTEGPLLFKAKKYNLRCLGGSTWTLDVPFIQSYQP